MVAVARRPRVTRREAAKILQTSYDNVRRLERTKQLATTKHDREGTVTYDRREVESLAQKRGLQVKPSGELAARVFELFAQHRKFHEIVIATQQEPDVIRGLWQQYRAGFNDATATANPDVEAREQQEARRSNRASDGSGDRTTTARRARWPERELPLLP